MDNTAGRYRGNHRDDQHKPNNVLPPVGYRDNIWISHRVVPIPHAPEWSTAEDVAVGRSSQNLPKFVTKMIITSLPQGGMKFN